MMLVKKKALPQRACCLGEGSALEQELIRRKLLKKRPDGLWELTTRETAGQGEICRPGDYIKLDSIGMPYPNDPSYFRANHTHLEGQWYVQNSRPVYGWTLEQPEDPIIRFLVESGRLRIDPEDPARTFSAFLWGTEQTAARDAVIIITATERSAGGQITDVSFHMVAGEEFRKTYDILQEDL